MKKATETPAKRGKRRWRITRRQFLIGAGVAGGTLAIGVAVGVPYPVAAIEVVRAELDPDTCRRLVLFGETMDVGELEGVYDEVVGAPWRYQSGRSGLSPELKRPTASIVVRSMRMSLRRPPCSDICPVCVVFWS